MKQQTETTSILDNPTVLERAIVYARVSTDEQAETGTSIDNQVEKSLAYAETNNIQVVAIFKEDYTGKALDRPELNKVREMLRNGQADNLIVYKTNRLDRSEWGVNLLILMQELKTLGVSLHYSQDNRKVDLNNPMEAFMYGSFAGWQAGEDHRETVSKLYEGRVKRAKNGYVVPQGNTPYGYKKVNIDKRWYFEIVESEAEIVRLIFQYYVVGDENGKTLSMLEIAEKLNNMGLKSRCGGRWMHGQVRLILKNETHAGTWHYRKSAAERDPSIKPIPVEVPAIVPREWWEQAQNQIAHNTSLAKRNRKPGRYLLATYVKCGDCGYKMGGRSRKNKKEARAEYLYYFCRNASKNIKERAAECDNPSYNAPIVDAKVWDRLEAVARDKDQLIAGLRGYQSQQESKVEPVKRELAYVEELIKEKNAEWEDELINLKVLTSERAKAKKAADIAAVEATIDRLEQRKVDLQSQFETKSITDEQIMNTVTFAAQVADDMAALREAEAKGQDNPKIKMAVYEGKRRLLEVLDLQVTLFVEDGRKKARITAKYCPDGDVLSVEESDTSNTCLNRENWLIFSDVIDLD